MSRHSDLSNPTVRRSRLTLFLRLSSFVIFVISLHCFLFLLLEKKGDTKFRHVFPVALSSIMRDVDEFRMAVNTEHTRNPLKVIGSDIHTSVYDKRDDFGFPIVNFPWLSGDVPRLPSYGIYISQLVRFARCCTSVFDFHSKNLQITSKLLTQGYRYHKLRKTFGKFFTSYSELLSKFGDISFQEYVFKGISHPVFYGDLVYKLRRVKDTPNFISSGSKIVKRLRRRQYDPLIIETTIGLVLGPCTALCRLFLKHCTLTNKAVGTIWRALSKPPQRRQGPDLRPLWLLVGTPSAIRPELAFSRAEHSLPYSDVTIYIFAILYLSSMPYV